MMFELVQNTGTLFNKFWQVMSLRSRSQLVAQLAEADRIDSSETQNYRLTKLLRGIEMKDKATLLNLLKKETSNELLQTLSNEELNDYFFYKNFN